MKIIPYHKRVNSAYIILQLRPCICGSRNVNVNNNKGWSRKSITCQKCRRTLVAPTIEEVMKAWNTEYLQKFPDNGFDDM